MITDPKIGDVVYLGGEFDDNGWFGYLGTDRWVVAEVRPKEISNQYQEEEIPLRLRNFRTGRLIRKSVYDGESGMWARWFLRDEFLTAARNAQKEDNATRTTEETTAQ